LQLRTVSERKAADDGAPLARTRQCLRRPWTDAALRPDAAACIAVIAPHFLRDGPESSVFLSIV